jgi:hypothetical protein
VSDDKRVLIDPALTAPARRDPPWPQGREPWAVPNYDVTAVSDALLVDIARFHQGVSHGAQAELTKRAIDPDRAFRQSIDALKRSTDRAGWWTILLTAALVVLTVVLIVEGRHPWNLAGFSTERPARLAT